MNVTPKKVIFLFFILFDSIFFTLSVKNILRFSLDLITDLIIIHTEWDEFKALDFKKLSKKRKFKIYDMRNLYSPQNMKKQGFSYHSLGRQN